MGAQQGTVVTTFRAEMGVPVQGHTRFEAQSWPQSLSLSTVSSRYGFETLEIEPRLGIRKCLKNKSQEGVTRDGKVNLAQVLAHSRCSEESYGREGGTSAGGSVPEALVRLSGRRQ